MQDVLDPSTPYDKVYMVRSLHLQERYLPGDHEDKSNQTILYKNMVKYMFKMPDDSSFEMLHDNSDTADSSFKRHHLEGCHFG